MASLWVFSGPSRKSPRGEPRNGIQRSADAPSGFLHRAQQRVLVEPRILVDLRHLRFSDFAREDPANAAAAGVDVQHDLGGLVEVHAEKADQHVDHEVHRGVVVVQQQDGIQRRPRHFRLACFHGNAVVVFLVVVGRSGHGAIIAAADRCPAAAGMPPDRRCIRHQCLSGSPSSPGAACMKPWALVATCIAFAMPCHAWAQPVVPPGGTPTPEVTWETGVQPGFIRSVGFAEHTPDTPVRMRGIRPDLGPVYAWKGTPLWLVVEVDPASSSFPDLASVLYTHLCAEWPKPDPDKPPLREWQPLPKGREQLPFAAPPNRNWPEGRYAVRLSMTAQGLIAGRVGAPRPPPSNIGTVTYAIGGEPQAAAAAATATTVGSESDTPAFPWPPPRATVRTVLDRDMTFGGAANLGAVAERLSDALHAAGYESPAFYSAPGGYAMVARLEQIEADGTPKPVPMRWSTALPSREIFSLRDYFSALFSAPEGHYRVIVFVVSDKPFATSRGAASREQAAAWLQGGLNLLPAAIANLPVSANHACTALIYQFHKQGFQGEAVSVLDGAPEASVQLRRTSILDEQGRLNQ